MSTANNIIKIKLEKIVLEILEHEVNSQVDDDEYLIKTTTTIEYPKIEFNFNINSNILMLSKLDLNGPQRLSRCAQIKLQI